MNSNLGLITPAARSPHHHVTSSQMIVIIDAGKFFPAALCPPRLPWTKNPNIHDATVHVSRPCQRGISSERSMSTLARLTGVIPPWHGM
jgi:hypothetical protein